MGTPAATNGLYKTIVTMLVESFALYTVTFLLFIGTWGAKSNFVYTFFPILVETQVRPTCFRNVATFFQPWWWIGNSSVTHHFTGRQSRSIDWRSHLRDRWDNSFRGSVGVRRGLRDPRK